MLQFQHTMDQMEMDAKQKLKRFCYLGSFEPVYIRPRVGLKVDQLFPPLKELVKTLDDIAFVGYMSDIVRQADLPRKDEAFFAYATYLASEVAIKFKINARKAVTCFLKTAEDLFMFCKYSKNIQVLLGRKGLSRTTKKAIVAWYQEHTPEVLREMWMSHRGMYGFSHKNLIHMCHINDDTLGDDSIGSAFMKTCSELIKEDLLKDANSAIMEMSTLRTTQNKNEAMKIIKKLKLSWDQVPPHLFKFWNILEMLLPQMGLIQIIKKWHTFHQHRHFDNPKIFKVIVSLTNREALQKANIHPTVFLWRMDRLGIPVAAAELQKVAEKRALTMRMGHFQQMYRDSFSLNNAVGLRFFITMTLQDNYTKKFITKHKKVTYYEAAVSFAFSYFKREIHTDVFAYTDDKVRLAQIPWEKGIQLSQAMDVCNHYTYKKSSQRLVQPLMEALSRKEVYDLFLIIVPSAGRSNPNQSSSFLCKFLDKYRETKNNNAKFVIISLLKHKKSMSYSRERNENILEICGLDSHTASVIDSFALNRFG